jgi:hypothetical protein
MKVKKRKYTKLLIYGRQTMTIKYRLKRRRGNMIEHMGYISIAAEIANIVMYLGMLFNIELSRGFFVGSGIYNFVYAFYTVFILLYRNNICRIFAAIILLFGVFKELYWSENAVISIVDSLVCLVLLILIDRFNEKIKKENENNHESPV